MRLDATTRACVAWRASPRGLSACHLLHVYILHSPSHTAPPTPPPPPKTNTRSMKNAPVGCVAFPVTALTLTSRAAITSVDTHLRHMPTSTRRYLRNMISCATRAHATQPRQLRARDAAAHATQPSSPATFQNHSPDDQIHLAREERQRVRQPLQHRLEHLEYNAVRFAVPARQVRSGQARQGKARQGKARQGKARQGKQCSAFRRNWAQSKAATT